MGGRGGGETLNIFTAELETFKTVMFGLFDSL